MIIMSVMLKNESFGLPVNVTDSYALILLDDIMAPLD